MLDRGFGAGFISVHDPSCRCGKPSSCRKRVLHPGAHQPVISSETWDAYAAARKEPGRDRRGQRRNAPHIFSGFIICGHCRGGMHATSQKGMPAFICGARVRQGARTTGVKCNNVWVQRSLVTEAVLEVLAAWAHGIEAAAEHAQGNTSSPIEDESVRLQRELKKVEADLARQTDYLSTGVIPPADYIPARDRLHAQRDSIQQQLANLTAASADDGFDFRDAVPVIEGLLQEWDVLPAEDRRRLLMEVIDRVEVWRDRLAPARIVVVPRWEGGEPIVRELPGRHRMEALRTAIVKVLAEAPKELRYKKLIEAADRLVPCARNTAATAVRTLVEDGVLTRRVVPGKATFYGLADPGNGQPREKGMSLAETMRAEILKVLTDQLAGARYGELWEAVSASLAGSKSTFNAVAKKMTAEGLLEREVLRGKSGRAALYRLAAQPAAPTPVC